MLVAGVEIRTFKDTLYDQEYKFELDAKSISMNALIVADVTYKSALDAVQYATIRGHSYDFNIAYYGWLRGRIDAIQSIFERGTCEDSSAIKFMSMANEIRFLTREYAQRRCRY